MASNDELKEVFQKLSETVVEWIDASSVIDHLFAANVLDVTDYDEVAKNYDKQGTAAQTRKLLSLLHLRNHPKAFVELREAIAKKPTNQHVTDDIDKCYRELQVEKLEKLGKPVCTTFVP